MVSPYLTTQYGEKVKAYLIRGARHLPILPEYPNPQLGWGVLCLRDSLPVWVLFIGIKKMKNIIF